MKICPVCNQTYTDESLNFCLNDGATLNADNDPPPTVFMDPPRSTNPNYTDFNSNFGKPNQEIYQAPYSPPVVNNSQDQTLPIVSLVIGVISFTSFCCFGFLAMPLGLGAVITGYLGMKKVDENPQKYGGKGMAIGGIILGAIGLVSGLVFIIFAIISSIVR